MYNIKLHSTVTKMTNVFYHFGMWGNENENASRQMAKKLLHFVPFATFLISAALGAFVSQDWNECVFMAVAAVMIAVLTLKLFYICWRREMILRFLHEVSEHSIKHHNTFIRINNRIESFIKFGYAFLAMILMAQLSLTVPPLFLSEKILSINIWFPLDWKTSAISYWIAYFFAAGSLLYLCVISFLTIILWYMMLNCTIKYEILGDQFREMGEMEATPNKSLIPKADKEKAYLRNLYALIETHQNIKE